MLLRACVVQPDRVEKARADDVEARDAFGMVQVQFGRNVADVLLDLPDAFAGATAPAKQADVIGICLRMVAQSRQVPGDGQDILHTQDPGAQKV